MISTDKTAFAQLLSATTNQYYRVFSQSVLEIYWHCLKEYSLADIKTAFLNYSKQLDGKQFMPQPCDILRLLTGDSSKKTALVAWKKVYQAIRRVGGYQSIVFDDFRIHAVIDDMGGWIPLCQKTEKELAFAALAFQKRYRRYLLHRPYPYSSHLIGLFEQQNQKHQQPISEPLLFGNQAAALMTYLEGVKPDVLFASRNPSLPFVRSAHQLIVDAVNIIKKRSTDESD